MPHHAQRGKWYGGWLGRLAVVILAAAPYLRRVGERGWAYDDKQTVLNNPDVAYRDEGRATLGWSAQDLLTLLQHDFWGNDMWPGDAGGDGATRWSHHSWRPTVVLTFKLDYELSGHDVNNALPFHASNVMWHVLAAVAAHALCLELFSNFGRAKSNRGDAAALVAAAIFALHPIHTEVVSNVTGRAESMSAFFVLSAVLAYHAGGGETTAASRVCWVSLSWVCSLLSVTCKESGLVAPALCLAWDFCRGTGVPPEPADSDSGEEEESECRPPSKVQQGVRWVRGFACERRNWATLAVGCALVAGRVWWMSGGYKLAAAYIHNPIATQPFLTRMLTFFHVQMMALRLLVAPVALAHEHTPFDLVESASDPRLWLGVFTLAAWLGVLWLLVSPTNTTHPEDSRTLTYRRQRVACAALMLVVPYLPASHIFFYVAFVLAERTLFLPSLGMAMLLAELWSIASTDDSSTSCRVSAGSSGGEASTESSDGSSCSDSSDSGDIDGAPDTASGKLGKMPEIESGKDDVSPGWARLCANAAIAILLTSFAIRTDLRDYDWVDGLRLVESHLEVYPLNAMSIYGFAYERALIGEWDVAEDALHKAAVASPGFSDPLVLFADRATFRYENEDAGYAYYRHATEFTNSRAEFGMNVWLLGIKYNWLTKAAAELYAQHAYRSNYIESTQWRRLAILSTNYGCVVMMSPEDRIGNVDEAERLFSEAFNVALDGWPPALHNLAVLRAMQGRFPEAVSIMREARRLTQAPGRAYDAERGLLYSKHLATLEAFVNAGVTQLPAAAVDDKVKPGDEMNPSFLAAASAGLVCDCTLMRFGGVVLQK